MPTAAATGRNKVAAKVVITTTCEMRPVRRMVATSPGRSEPMAAKMRMALRAGTAIFATSPEKMTRITSIQTPDQIAAQRVRLPPATLSAVCPTEPPTGMPRKKPAARLPAPCATMSRFGSGRALPGLGAASATPAPWTITMAAMASAPVTMPNDSSLTSGRAGSGMPCGRSPWSPTLATVPAPASATTTVGITRAISGLTTTRRVRASAARMASALRPVRRAGRSMALGRTSTLRALANGKSPCAGAPVRPATWLQAILTAMPVKNPIITE